MDSQSSRPASGKGSSLAPSGPLPADTGRGRSFEGSLPPCQLQVGGIQGQHWRSLMFLQSRGLDDGGSLLWVHCPLPPPPTCVAGTSHVSFLRLMVCQGSGTSRRNGQDAGERLFGTDGLTRSRVLQPTFSGTEGDCGWVP